MKELILKNKALTGTIVVCIALIISTNVLNYFEKQELKAQMLEKSDEEIIIGDIKLSKQTIKDLENLLKNTEVEIQTETKKESCLKQQLDRLVEGLEYNLNYCDNIDNLSKFDEGL